MTYYYLDESGEMGFDFSKKGTSNHLLITFLILKEPRQVISLVKKVFTSLLVTTKRKNNDMLHAYYEKPSTIKRMLNGLASKDVKIATMRLDKRKVLITNTPHELYTSMVVALFNRLYTDGIVNNTDDVLFIASRKNTSRKLNDDFKNNVINRTSKIKIDIEIEKPSNDKCLQAVDFVSWALWQKYEMDDETYSNIIASKIIKEYEMYK